MGRTCQGCGKLQGIFAQKRQEKGVEAITVQVITRCSFISYSSRSYVSPKAAIFLTLTLLVMGGNNVEPIHLYGGRSAWFSNS